MINDRICTCMLLKLWKCEKMIKAVKKCLIDSLFIICIQSCAWWGQIPNCLCPAPRVLGLCRKPAWIVFSRIESIDDRAKFFNKKSYL